ncbi:MAG TPA: sigma-70 family RNA polymerase sigma factor [Kofleriaceae bacterium]
MERWLTEFVERGRAAWPEISVAAEALVAFAAPHMTGETSTAALASLDATGLHFAAALAAGNKAALDEFERVYVPRIHAALRRLPLDAGEIDDVTQQVRDKLLVGNEPRIANYAGHDLGALVHVVAVRTAMSLLRKRKRTVSLDGDALLRLADTGDVALDAIKKTQRDAFREAFAKAVADLEPRDRNLLRMHLLDGVQLEPLAKMHGVNRSTVVRWLGAARKTVFDATRKHLQAALGLERDEAEGLYGLIESRLDVSVERLLGSD